MRGPAAATPKAETMGEVLGLAERSPFAITFVEGDDEETSLSWAATVARARAAAGALRALGVGRGDRVAIVAPTGRGFLDAFFGASFAGAVPVPLYPPVRLGRLDEYHASTARMIDAVGASVVLADSRARRLLGQAVERSAPRLGCVVLDDLHRAGEAPLEVRARGEDLALIQFSSGSTVDPKPVALTHANVVAQLAALYHRMPPRPDAPRHACVTWLPLYHDMGLIGCLLGAAYFPGPITLLGPELFLARPGLWLRALARHRGTIAPAPNFAFALCAKRVKDAELAGLDLSSWRYALCGAEPIAAEVLRRFADRFAPYGFDPSSLLPVYGLSEATLAVTFAPDDRPAPRSLRVDAARLAADGVAHDADEGPARELVSVGAPLAGVEVELRDAAGRALPERHVGRVFVRGPAVMSGYFGAGAPALDAEGWLDTGDLGFEEGGELFVSGRAKDVVIVRGANHAPHTFEDALEGLAGLRAGCAVAFGAPGEGGERLVIVCERDRGTPAGADADLATRARSAVAERTGIAPDDVRVVAPGTLPRTSSGKLRRAEARRRYVDGALSAPKRVALTSIAFEMAKSTLSFARARRRPR